MSKWFVQFHVGDFSLDGAPQSGRPGEVDSDQIETLIGNNPCSTRQETANVLKISKSIKLLVKNEKCVFYCTEKEHTDFLAKTSKIKSLKT